MTLCRACLQPYPTDATVCSTCRSCRNCRRGLYYVEGVGWIHTTLPQYADSDFICETPHLVGCRVARCTDEHIPMM